VLSRTNKIVIRRVQKKGKRKGEELMAQLLKKIVPARGANKSEAYGLAAERRMDRPST